MGPQNTPARIKGKLHRLVKSIDCLVPKRKSTKRNSEKTTPKMVNSGGNGIQRPNTPEVLMNNTAKLSCTYCKGVALCNSRN